VVGDADEVRKINVAAISLVQACPR